MLQIPYEANPNKACALSCATMVARYYFPEMTWDDVAKIVEWQPGYVIWTPMREQFRSAEADVAKAVQTKALRKIARPQDIANAIVWLSSDMVAGHVTGEVITVSGGMEGRLIWDKNDIDPASV